MLQANLSFVIWQFSGICHMMLFQMQVWNFLILSFNTDPILLLLRNLLLYLEKSYSPQYLVWKLHEKWYSQLHGVYSLFTKVVCSWWQNPSRQWRTEVCLQNFLCWWKYDFCIMISKTVGREVKTRTWCNFYNNYYNHYNNNYYYYNYYNYNNYNYWEKVYLFLYLTVKIVYWWLLS